MPDPRRSLILLAVLVVGLGLAGWLASPPRQTQGRWPTDDALFNVSGWAVDSGQVGLGQDPDSTAVLLQKTYRNLTTAQPAYLAMWSNPQPEARALFRKGPDRDFLGAGFTTQPAPESLVPVVPGGGALIASKGDEQWLLIYMFGERRGAVGNGRKAWFYGEMDALLDQPNNYFLARVSIPFKYIDAPLAASANDLASTVFARLTAFYATV